MITGKIEKAKKSQSGKTLGVQIKGRWYQTKHWELESMVGETITITDHNDSTYRGETIWWLNEYETGGEAPPPVAASAQREHNQGRPDAADNYTESVMLLRFIGQCFAGYPFQNTDEAMVRSRARMLYKLGQDILSGDIQTVETGPRKGDKRPQPVRSFGEETPQVPDNDGPDASQGGFDDDIPF